LRLVLDKVDLTQLTRDDIMHPPVVVPLTKQVDEMFDFFQANNARAAAVLNEFGGVEGFVTMKDVFTFIFGQISGEMLGVEHYQERDENDYEVPGNMKLTDFNNLTNFGIEDPRMTTIGGVAFRHLDRLPCVGDQVTVEGIVMTVLEMEAHRIERVRVVRGVGWEEATGEATTERSGEEVIAIEANITGGETGEDSSELPEPSEATEEGNHEEVAEGPEGAQRGRS